MSPSESSTPTPRYFTVCPRKLVVMNLVTFGGYGLYWGFSHWLHHGSLNPDKRIWPLWRTLFRVFFWRTLFKEFHQSAQRVHVNVGWGPTRYAIVMVLLFFWTRGIERYIPYGSLYLSMFFLIRLIESYVLSQVQTTVNLVNQDPDAERNRQYTSINWVFLVLGAGLWWLNILEIFNINA